MLTVYNSTNVLPCLPEFPIEILNETWCKNNRTDTTKLNKIDHTLSTYDIIILYILLHNGHYWRGDRRDPLVWFGSHANNMTIC